MLSSINRSLSLMSNINLLVPVRGLPISFVDSSLAKHIDDRLMKVPGFSIDQLMELAGLSVACAANDLFHSLNNNDAGRESEESNLVNPLPQILIYCGPGNNGGDGLVAARHLSHFGYNPIVVYPKRGKTPLFTNLVEQCIALDIPVMEALPDGKSHSLSNTKLIIDALFGFSFEGPSREPFTSIITSLATSSIPVLSVDIPSGWNVNDGDIFSTGFNPAAVISLTTPKLCMQGYSGKHYIGGRFMPPKLAAELQIKVPQYGVGSSQQVILVEDPVPVCSNSLDL